MSGNDRYFLSRVVPWIHETDKPAYVSIHTKYQPPNAKDPVYPGRAFVNIDDALQFIDWQRGSTDLYVCMSAQGEYREAKTDANGRAFFTARRNKWKSRGHKSFYVDWDVKPDDLTKGYATHEEALSECARLFQAIGWPAPSLAVPSGSGGFHTHHISSRILTGDEWDPIAIALRDALISHGFRGDVQCIVDRTRILRIPDTFNFKYGKPLPVTLWGKDNGDYDPQVLAALLQAAGPRPAARSHQAQATPSGLAPQSTVLGAVNGALNDMAAGVGYTPTIEEIAAVCPFIAHTLSTNGADCNEPLWFMALNVAVHCHDSRMVAHRLSSGHADYVISSTDAKLDERLKARRGWPQCASIAAPQCSACPKFKLGKSPINFAGIASHTPPGNPPPNGHDELFLPVGYALNQMNLIVRIKESGEGAQHEIRVFNVPLARPSVDEDHSVICFSTRSASGRNREIGLPFSDINSRQTLGSTFSKQGIFLTEHQTKEVRDLMPAWVEKLRANNCIAKNLIPWGWTGDSRFAIAGTIYGGPVEEKSTMEAGAVATNYTPKGTLEPWLKASRMITSAKRPDLNLILITAFAAPLVKFTEQKGLILSAYSVETGVGKTTALRAAQTAVGSVRGMHSLNDTIASVSAKISMVKHLPIYWDEIRPSDRYRNVPDFLFQLSSGKGRHKMSKSMEIDDGGDWDTLMVTAGNRSLIGAIRDSGKGSAANMVRVFEFTVPKATVWAVTQEEMISTMQGLNDNYGNAGVVYAKFLGANSGRIQKDVQAMWGWVRKRFSMTDDERFLTATIVVCVLGALYASQLKLVDVDTLQLADFMGMTVTRLRSRRVDLTDDLASDENVAEYLIRYMSICRTSQTVITDTINLGPGRPAQQLIKNGTQQLRSSIEVHIGEKDGNARVSLTGFVEWLNRQGVASDDVVERLCRLFPVKSLRTVLAAGTTYSTGKMKVLEFNRLDPKFKGAFDQ